MLKASILFILVLAPSVTYAQSTTTRATTPLAKSIHTYDLSLGVDNRLAVTVPDGLTILFHDQTGRPIEVRESGRVSLRPGLYSVQTGDQFVTCRVWAYGSAPPVATRELPVVRGQSPRHSHLQCVQHAIIATGIGLVVWGAATAS